MSKRTVTREELDQPLVPYTEAVATILGAFPPLPPVEVPLSEALGTVLAEDVVAEFDVPGFANSAMDGYAIRAADTAGEKPVVLRLVDDLPAGSAPHIEITQGTAAKIMTGAPLPPGADAVVPWEDTEPSDSSVAVLVDVPSGKHVRPRGEDVAEGTSIISDGAELRPVHLGVLASLVRMCARIAVRASRCSRPVTNCCRPARPCAKEPCTTPTGCCCARCANARARPWSPTT
jgi:molybdopterin molybdotransferase